MFLNTTFTSFFRSLFRSSPTVPEKYIAKAMSCGISFVTSEALDFAAENTIYLSIVALVCFYVGVEGR